MEKSAKSIGSARSTKFIGTTETLKMARRMAEAEYSLLYGKILLPVTLSSVNVSPVEAYSRPGHKNAWYAVVLTFFEEILRFRRGK